MITEIKTLPTESLQAFLEKTASGLQTMTISDSNEIVVFKKRFDADTGVELKHECIAAVPVQAVLDEIANCTLRLQLISDFVSAKGLA